MSYGVEVRRSRRARYKRLKAEGICVRCEKNKAVDNKVDCSDCAKRFNRQKREGVWS